MHLELKKERLDLSHPRVMGVLNRTPDSFSDGGAFVEFEAALIHARRMLQEGADFLDVGGESTRPGAAPVTVEEELARVLPLIERLAAEPGVRISVDTSKPEVMRAAVKSGAVMINDVYALRQPGALEAAAESGAAVCLMHMQGEPRSMQQAPHYTDVTREVTEFLLERAEACRQAGIPRARIALDPGFGFGKTLEHNLTLLRELPDLAHHGYPVLAGLSRKSMLGTLLGGKPVEERLHASVAAATVAAMNGASILRVHDVGPTVDALKVTSALAKPRSIPS
ncbi:MAG TPA: dihydropteroate synthase [Gammaproteobacteria bacterium]|nr:dihydropteroate synthase [Gammaproteobacteria bacterium]